MLSNNYNSAINHNYEINDSYEIKHTSVSLITIYFYYEQPRSILSQKIKMEKREEKMNNAYFP